MHHQKKTYYVIYLILTKTVYVKNAYGDFLFLKITPENLIDTKHKCFVNSSL